MNTPSCRSPLGLVPLVLLLGLPARGEATILPASDSGFFNAMGRSSKNDGVVMGVSGATFNYSAGAIDEVPPLLGPPYGGVDVPRKNYVSFDLSGVSTEILGASLELFLPMGGYGSPDPTETFVLYGSLFPGVAEMTGFAAALASPLSIFAPGPLEMAKDHYAKLGDTKGAFPAFGFATLAESDEGSMVTIPLTASGVAYLNLFKGGTVILSGELATLDGTPGVDEFVFGFSAPLISGVVSPDPSIEFPTPVPALHVDTAVIPEPSAVGAGILCAAAAAVGWCRRRLQAFRP